jgi:hypothetical protein
VKCAEDQTFDLEEHDRPGFPTKEDATRAAKRYLRGEYGTKARCEEHGPCSGEGTRCVAVIGEREIEKAFDTWPYDDSEGEKWGFSITKGKITVMCQCVRYYYWA